MRSFSPSNYGRGVVPAAAGNGGAPAATEFERHLGPGALLHFSSVSVVGATTAGLIGTWNRGAEMIFGYTRAEVLGKPVAILAPPERATEMEELRARAERGEFTEPIETERLAKDGRRVRLLMAVSPVRDKSGRMIGTVAVGTDVTAWREAEGRLAASERRYQAIVEALHDGVMIIERGGRIVAYNESAKEILGVGDDQLAAVDADRPSTRLLRPDGRPLPADQQPHLLAMRSGKPQQRLIVGVVRPDGEVRWLECNSTPLFREGESKPYAVVCSFKDVTAERSALQALESARLEDLKRLALLSEFRDDETRRHTERVARTSQAIARALGLDEDYVLRIGRAAPLHDVGKVGIPDAILLKPGRLTDAEFRVMKTHTVIGGEILADSDFAVLQMAMEIALTHHERYDGGGYPRGLKGEEIPLCGRIVAVADAFDAMTHDRPYRKAIPPARAVAELKRCAGTQFDPKVVEAFLSLDPNGLVDPGGPGA